MSNKTSGGAGKLVWGAVLLLVILHQDVWFWDTFEPLVFGFIPVGLAYHALISLLAGLVWFLATKFCWPEGLEEDASQSDS